MIEKRSWRYSISENAKNTINSFGFLLLFSFAVLLGLFDGAEFELVNIARFSLYGIVAVIFLTNLSNRFVLKTAALAVVFLLVEYTIFLTTQYIDQGQLLKFIAMIVSVSLFPMIKVGDRVKQIAALIGLLALVYLFFSSFILYAAFFGLGLPSWVPQLNPNSAAAITLFLFIMLTRLRTWRHLTWVLLFSLSVVAILNFESRTILAAMLIYLGTIFILKRKKKPVNFSPLYVLIVAFAVIMPFAYVNLSESYDEGYEAGTVGSKQLFSGRQSIWSEVFEASNGSTILHGLGASGIVESLNVKGLHNSYIAIYYYFGILGVLFFITMLYRTFKATDNINIFASGLAILFICCFETTFTEGDYIAILMYLSFINLESSR